MPATLKDWEGNHVVVSFCSLTVALAVLTMRDLFCTVDPESYLETSCTSVNVTAMQVEKKKGKIPTLEANLSKDSWQIVCLKRCWFRCINGFPNYPSVRRLLDSSADINISASSSPPSCQHCHIYISIYIHLVIWHTSCKLRKIYSAILIPAPVCIDERDHKLTCNCMDIVLICHWLTMWWTLCFYCTFGTIACMRIFLFCNKNALFFISLCKVIVSNCGFSSKMIFFLYTLPWKCILPQRWLSYFKIIRHLLLSRVNCVLDGWIFFQCIVSELSVEIPMNKWGAHTWNWHDYLAVTSNVSFTY